MLLRREKGRESNGENLSFPIKVVWMTDKGGKTQRRTTMREE